MLGVGTRIGLYLNLQMNRQGCKGRKQIVFIACGGKVGEALPRCISCDDVLYGNA